MNSRNMMRISQCPPHIQRELIQAILDTNDGKSYLVRENVITCLPCGQTSFNMGDVTNLFCLNCGYHADIARDLFIPKRNPNATIIEKSSTIKEEKQCMPCDNIDSIMDHYWELNR